MPQSPIQLRLAAEPAVESHIIQRNPKNIRVKILQDRLQRAASQVQATSIAIMEVTAPLRFIESTSMTGRVRKVRMDVAMPRAANEK